MAMLQVDSINVFYGSIHAIKDVSFSVEQGEIVTLIGANGAGKSTILKTVSGLLRSKGGSVQFHDNSMTGAAPHRIVSMGLAHVPEGRHVFAQMTVEENLEMGAYTRPQGEIAPGLERVYIRFPRLKERRKQISGTLSGGEQQIFAIVKELHKDGVTVLLVEQNAQMALSVADRGYVLETGKIVLTGEGKALLEDGAVKKAYLGG